MATTLVIGATGVLGREVVGRLRAEGRTVRALVRAHSDPEKVQALRDVGADIVEGDLKDPDTLPAACAGVTHVVSTASSTLSRGEGDTIDSVDRQGQLNLIEAARKAGVQQFVLVSFPPASMPFPLQDAKRAAEDALRASGMSYTILHPTHFWEIWCSPALGFDPQARTARIFGEGTAPMQWVSFFDVAAAVVRSLDNPAAINRRLTIGGPAPLSQLDIVRVFEEVGGQPFAREHVPLDVLRSQFETVADPLQQSFIALMLLVASGEWVFDNADVQAALGLTPTPIEAFARHVYAGSASA